MGLSSTNTGPASGPAAKPALLLGVGNVLLSDEGVGVRAVEQFAHRYRYGSELEVVDGGTSGMELLDMIADRELVVVVDAVVTGDAPGTVVTLRDDEVPAFFSRKISPHQLGLSDLLSALIMTGEQPQKIILVGVVPHSIELGIGLTPATRALLDTVVERVRQEFAAEGVQLEPAADDSQREQIIATKALAEESA